MNSQTFAGLMCVALSSGVHCAPPVTAMPACVPAGVPVMHSGRIANSERWAGGIHVVTSSLSLADNTVLTVSACSEVRLAPDASIEVTGAASALVTEGTAERPVVFSRNASASAWGRVLVRATGSVRLRHTVLEGGGGTSPFARGDFHGATIAAQGDPEALPAMVTVNQVAVRGSTGLGIAMIASRFAAESSDLTISASGWHPVYLGADTATELPTGSYAGNAQDEFLLQNSNVASYSNDRPIKRDATLRNRGLPYLVGVADSGGSLIRVGDGRDTGPASSVLEIEAGVTLRFSPSAGNSGVLVQGRLVAGAWVAQGALRAVGTASSPVTFTSAAATPAAGDWMGLFFKSALHPQTTLDQVVIAFAGGPSQTRGVCSSTPGDNLSADSAVIITLEPGHIPDRAFVTHTTLRDSANGGIYRGWYDAMVDFTATNTFERIAGCRQSNVARASGGCTMGTCM
ncbi:MAG: hypothetical protein Q8Q09_06870 [Deltaproteobacteria bacterium]|nr:hypothetical protein [Deltaproteobacteria bacterium]